MAQPYLAIQTADGAREVPITDKPITVGRHPTNMVVLTDGMASRYHCVIEKGQEGLRVRDLDSSNGTKVNGQVIKTWRLGDGDVVQIGRSTLTVHAPELAPAPKPKAPVAVPAAEEDDEEFEVEVVEVGDDEMEEVAPPGGGGYEAMLLRMAESLADKKFTDDDIALINARGALAHPSKPASGNGRKGRGAEPREAVGIFRLILLICFRTRASDIHIEPKQDDYSVRIRADGSMVDVVRLPKDVGIRVTSLIKILCDIDISQKGIVQEGHFSARVPDRRVDYRISFAPAMFGQKCVIRILDTANTPYHVWDLQLPEWMFEEVQRATKADSGMILVCGPTGSGKTSTLYAVIRDIDVSERNVVTIEDPVEIQLDGVTQIPVNDAQGNTFGALLRSVLRQDPDAILVGEVRDPETARIALQAAITGHLVFSTVHSKDTIGTIFRLLDLGVEPYLVSSGLQLVLGQRLVRKLCPACKTASKPTPEQIQRMGKAGEGAQKIYSPRGCPKCVGTGFMGRRGVFELLSVTDEMREVIMKSPSVAEVQKSLTSSKFVKLSQSGYQLVADGITSIDEIERSM
ncbi:MAG TPA: ATPase, T2SS/T4P/T4SS family [Tepidisphaeraceae bacterium]|nr:ATPase, T2SS/T4P/T4SS family [Tepidisphaeraceae bacterium]